MSDIRCTFGVNTREEDDAPRPSIGTGKCPNMATRHFRSGPYPYIVVSRCDKHMLDDHDISTAFEDGWYEVTYESLVVAEVHES